MPNKYGRFVTDFVRHFLFYKIQCCSIYLNKISFKFTDKETVFAHFVRNCHFSSSPFTDKISIFIDVSVNDGDFAKCSVC